MGIIDTLALILAVLKYYNLIDITWSSIGVLVVIDVLWSALIVSIAEKINEK